MAGPAFRPECAILLEFRTRGRTAGLAPVGVSWGWMSSERVTAGRLVELARSGSISDADMAKLKGLVSRYAAEITADLRRVNLRGNPELVETARIFSEAVTGGSGEAAPSVVPPVDSEARDPEESPPTEAKPDETTEGAPADETVARVIAALRQSPGLRSEELAEHLGIATAFLSPALRQLIDSGRIRRTGAGRGTRYFPR